MLRDNSLSTLFAEIRTHNFVWCIYSFFDIMIFQTYRRCLRQKPGHWQITFACVYFSKTLSGKQIRTVQVLSLNVFLQVSVFLPELLLTFETDDRFMPLSLAFVPSGFAFALNLEIQDIKIQISPFNFDFS